MEPGASEQGTQLAENAPRHSFIFHHEGSFVPETVIAKGNNFGAESCFTVTQRASELTAPDFDQARSKYEQHFPQQELFPNGLSREQAVVVMSAWEAVVKFNGGYPDEHGLERNAALYATVEDEEIPLEQFKGKAALSCAESAALTQQLIAPALEVTYVSGSADLQGTETFEMHSFNLVKPADTRYVAAILDLANPAYQQAPDGSVQVKLYCAPMTNEQLERFKRAEPVNLEYAGTKRTYQFETGPEGLKPYW